MILDLSNQLSAVQQALADCQENATTKATNVLSELNALRNLYIQLEAQQNNFVGQVGGAVDRVRGEFNEVHGSARNVVNSVGKAGQLAAFEQGPVEPAA